MSKKQRIDHESSISPEQKSVAEASIVSHSKKIDFFITEYSIEILALKMKDQEYYIPEYQRANTWEIERKSRFVESIMMGLPIPFIFFWESSDGRLEIVDGSQRLRTLKEFLYNELTLTKLKVIPELNGFKFDDLLESRQRKVKNRSIRGIVLNEHADSQARFDLFNRINTGPKVANRAEIRRGSSGGPFLDMVIDLSADPLFIALAPMSEKAAAERENEDLITRMFAYGDGLKDYKDRPAEFLQEYVIKMNLTFTEDASLESRYREMFYSTMELVSRISPYGFRKSSNGISTPKTRFEALAVGSYRALLEDENLLLKVNEATWIEDPEFIKIVSSGGANARASLNRRIDYVKSRLLGK